MKNIKVKDGRIVCSVKKWRCDLQKWKLIEFHAKLWGAQQLRLPAQTAAHCAARSSEGLFTAI